MPSPSEIFEIQIFKNSNPKTQGDLVRNSLKKQPLVLFPPSKHHHSHFRIEVRLNAVLFRVEVRHTKLRAPRERRRKREEEV